MIDTFRLFPAYDWFIQIVPCIWLVHSDCSLHMIDTFRLFPAYDWYIQTVPCMWLIPSDCCLHMIGTFRLFPAYDWYLQIVACVWLVHSDCSLHMIGTFRLLPASSCSILARFSNCWCWFSEWFPCLILSRSPKLCLALLCIRVAVSGISF